MHHSLTPRWKELILSATVLNGGWAAYGRRSGGSSACCLTALPCAELKHCVYCVDDRRSKCKELQTRTDNEELETGAIIKIIYCYVLNK